MSPDDMLIIKIPASTANLGPGFDSVGLALSLYLTLEAERSDRWEVIPLTDELKAYPTDESNMMVAIALQTAAQFGKNLSPCKIRVMSEIPVARGLGSSASAIVAGIELANSLANLKLSNHEKLAIAAKIEGHPDNVGASIFGGLVIGSMSESGIDVIHSNLVQFDVIAVVPKEELLTKESRGVLPNQLSFYDAVHAGAVGNVMVAALLSGDLKLAGKMMSQDLYHQPYRKKLVPYLEELEKMAPVRGAYGIALSGAGPTVICLAESGKGQALLKRLQEELPHLQFLHLTVDQGGSKVTQKRKVI